MRAGGRRSHGEEVVSEESSPEKACAREYEG